MEKDKFIETIQSFSVGNLKEKIADGFDNPAEVKTDYDDSKWNTAFADARDEAFAKRVKWLFIGAT